MQDTFARARTRPSARATIGYLVYKDSMSITKYDIFTVFTILAVKLKMLQTSYKYDMN